MINRFGRPFKSIEQMDETILKRWNDRVKENDIVYVLGDVCWGYNSQKIEKTIGKLNGIKHLIYGNHDRLGPHKLSKVWATMQPYLDTTIENKQVVMMHYPIADWHGAYRKSIHLYGHCHGNFDLASIAQNLPHHNNRCMDVGVDTNNFYPYSWDEIKAKLSL
jgi:calcineurin-like phosphoesterase family protein